jgi:phosphoribosyl-ATP pyrophosphohydrolase/phosphoribosyl-AMP cyclohydrolase
MNIDFSKNTDGLIPAIIQDSEQCCFNVGLYECRSISKTIDTKSDFYSRKQRLWTKGEESEFLNLIDIKMTVTMILY